MDNKILCGPANMKVDTGKIKMVVLNCIMNAEALDPTHC